MKKSKRLLKSLVEASLSKKRMDLLVRGKIFDVFTGEVFDGCVGISSGYICGFGDYDADEVLDYKGLYLLPGYIDSHVHIESSMLTPCEFGKLVILHGTVAAVADPHEIANVAGTFGIRYLISDSRFSPTDIFFMLPTCVPAKEDESSGAVLLAKDLLPLLNEDRVLGLGEVMDFSSIFSGKDEIFEKLLLHDRIDGHLPGIVGKELFAYVVSGPLSDHEVLSKEEALEKVRCGMYVMVREGSCAKNLKDVVPAINQKNSFRFLFATDDRSPKEIEEEGHIDFLMKKAIDLGVDTLSVIRMATINPATYFGLKSYGAISPGKKANICVVETLKDPRPIFVIKDGKKYDPDSFNKKAEIPRRLRESVNVKAIEKHDIEVRREGKFMHVIGLLPDTLLTKDIIVEPKCRGDIVISDTDNDILKVLVIERHKAKGNFGVGFLKGLGLKKGALAQTVGHDSHNLICCGTNDDDMMFAIEKIISLGGGKVVVSDGKVLAALSLNIAGLMSEKDYRGVILSMGEFEKAFLELGISIRDPFMALSFAPLPVIPELRITDRGLFDVRTSSYMPLFLNDS